MQENQQASGKSEEYLQGKTKTRKKRAVRRFLLLLGPMVVCIAVLSFYILGGRYEETDNAYVQADKVTVAAEVSGPITTILVQENQLVQRGTPLFTIDTSPYKIALEQAEARLQSELAEIRIEKANYKQKENELKLAESDLRFAEKEYNRQAALDTRQAVAKSQLDDARHALEVSRQKREVIAREMEQILAGLEGDADVAPEKIAGYRLAKAQLDEAALNVERTTVFAPFSGRVSQLPKVGFHAATGAAVLSLVADDHFWIEANMKETQLTHIQTGQTVEISVDTYPDERWQGTVESISPATGSEFSLIPAQNASGNWVKVVQRIPVRIAVVNHDKQPALRVGMSADVTIDTKYRRKGAMKIVQVLGFFHTADTAHAAENPVQSAK